MSLTPEPINTTLIIMEQYNEFIVSKMGIF